MTVILLDTHVWAWTLLLSSKISTTARLVNDRASERLISAASLYEISQKCRIGKWPEMAPFVDDLISSAAAQGIEIVGLDAGTCLLAGALDWTHRDPFDRFIAATAIEHGIELISADKVFDGVVPRIW